MFLRPILKDHIVPTILSSDLTKCPRITHNEPGDIWEQHYEVLFDLREE